MRPLVRTEFERIPLPSHQLEFKIKAGKYFHLPPNAPYPILKDGSVITYQSQQTTTESRDICLGLFNPLSILDEPINKVPRPYLKKVLVIKDSIFDIVSRNSQTPGLFTQLTQAKDLDALRREQRAAVITTSAKLIERVAWALLLVSREEAQRRILLTQNLIADLAATSRIATNQAMKQLERLGMLINDTASYRIKDSQAEESLRTLVSRNGPHLLPSNIPSTIT